MKVYIVYSYSWPDFEMEGVFFDENAAKKLVEEKKEYGYYMETWDSDTYKVHIDNFQSEIVKVKE